jgi:ribosomal protein L16 Arg81 hydroxylase
LRAATRCQVELIVFVTPPHSYGAARHADDAEVFAIQLHGAKTWQLWRKSDDDEQPLVEVLTAGRGLYVPMHMDHRAASRGETSVHLTVTLRPPTMQQALLAAFAKASAELPRVRFMPADPSERVAELTERLARLRDELAEIDVTGLLAEVERDAGCRPVSWRGLTAS